MDTAHIKEFAVLAEVQNYLEASELLFISQSSLSKHIKALEAELGAQLFDRTTRRVRLNEAGRVFLEFARQVVAQQYQTTARIRSLTSQRAYRLTIGSIPVMAPYGITDAIAAFKRDNADFSVSLLEGDAKALKQSLRQNQCELAFIRDDGEEDPEFSRIPFASDFLAAVLPPGHHLVGRKTVRLEELEHEDFMLLSQGSLLHELSLGACRRAGFEPRVVFTGARAENILDLVSQGMGVGLLMRKAAKRLVGARVAIIEVVPSVETFIKLYYRADQELSPTARHFIDSVIVNHTIHG